MTKRKMGCEVMPVDLHRYFNETGKKNGIWFCRHVHHPDSSFSDEVQDRLYSLEDTSWWFRYRAEVIAKIMGLYFKKEPPVFDVGGGNGYTACCMQNRGYNCRAAN